MIIDNDLVVRISDGIIVFEEPTLRDWAVMVDMSGKSLEEQADVIVPKIKEISGFQYKDGSVVTLEDLRNKKFSAKFLLQVIQAWSKTIVGELRGEAEQKNDVTVN